MSNIILNNPWVLDTAAASVITSGSGVIQALFWDIGAAGAAGDAISLTDEAGAVKYAFTLPADDAPVQPQQFPTGLFTGGLILPTLARGKLYVYWQPGRVPQ